MNGYGSPGVVVPLPQRRQPSIQPFTPRFASSFEGAPVPQLEWLVPGLLLKGEVTLFAGQTKLGKTMLCQMLLTAAAMGLPWLGVDIMQFRGLGYFAEDPEAVLRIRQAAINKYYGISHADLETEVSWISREDGDARLVNFDKWSSIPRLTARFRQLERFVKDTGVVVVPIDTSARTFGGSENDRAQATAFIEVLSKLASEIGGAIILNSHPNRSGGFYSGSSAWESSVRITVSLERPEGYIRETGEREDDRILYGMGANYGRKLRGLPMHWAEGVFVADDAPARRQSLTQAEKTDLDYRMIAGLRRLVENGTAVTADEDKPGHLAKRARAKTPEFRGWPLGWLQDSVARIIDAGQVERVELRGAIVLRPAGMVLPGERPWQPM